MNGNGRSWGLVTASARRRAGASNWQHALSISGRRACELHLLPLSSRRLTSLHPQQDAGFDVVHHAHTAAAFLFGLGLGIIAEHLDSFWRTCKGSATFKLVLQCFHESSLEICGFLRHSFSVVGFHPTTSPGHRDALAHVVQRRLGGIFCWVCSPISSSNLAWSLVVSIDAQRSFRVWSLTPGRLRGQHRRTPFVAR